MLRSVFLFLIAWAVLGGLSSGARAQSAFQIRVTDAPLETALVQVRAQTNLDLVYADRLVQGRTTSCTYTGTDRTAALNCVLDGTGVRAERVRRRQYVLVDAGSGQDGSEARRASLNGYVVDAKTGERLPGAHIYLTELEAGATTNRDGYFVVSDLPPEAYDARISYLGYQSLDTTLTAGEDPAQIALVAAPIETEGVVVEAGSTSANEDERLPGMMSVALDRLGQLPSFGEPDLFRALQWTPGIRKSGVTGGGLSVRGGNPDQNLYLLDGAPVYHPWHAFSLVSTFQTGTLRSTDLYRGSFPVEHGGRLSAVLDEYAHVLRDLRGLFDLPPQETAQEIAAAMLDAGADRVCFADTVGHAGLDLVVIGRQRAIDGHRTQRLDPIRRGSRRDDLAPLQISQRIDREVGEEVIGLDPARPEKDDVLIIPRLLQRRDLAVQLVHDLKRRDEVVADRERTGRAEDRPPAGRDGLGQCFDVDRGDFQRQPAGVRVRGAAPGSGDAITAGFAFDVPVRFDTDLLDVTLDLERLGSITSIPLLEIRR